MAAPRKLGRGLAALLDEAADAPAAAAAAPAGAPGGAVLLPIDKIENDPRQPRAHFNKEAMAELAQSIAERGVLQPILVRPVDGGYVIVAGERRWRAAQAARLHEIPAVIRDFDEKEALTVAIVENVQRADLNALEEGDSYQRLMNEFGYTQDEVAKAVGKSRSHVANLIRILDLPRKAQGWVATGELTMGHARALLMAADPDELAEQAVRCGYSVRDLEARVTEQHRHAKAPKREKPERSADIAALERQLSEVLGLRVVVEHGRAGGRVQIAYRDMGQLDMVCRRLSGGRV